MWRRGEVLPHSQWFSISIHNMFSLVFNCIQFFQWFSIVQSVHSLFNIFPTWFANLSVFCFCFAETCDPLGRVAWQHEDAVSAWRFWGRWPYLQIGFIEFQCYIHRTEFQNVSKCAVKPSQDEGDKDERDEGGWWLSREISNLKACKTYDVFTGLMCRTSHKHLWDLERAFFLPYLNVTR